jgi:hypothetical protein
MPKNKKKTFFLTKDTNAHAAYSFALRKPFLRVRMGSNGTILHLEQPPGLAFPEVPQSFLAEAGRAQTPPPSFSKSPTLLNFFIFNSEKE